MQIVILPPGDNAALIPARETFDGSSHAEADVPCPVCRAPKLIVEGRVAHVVRADTHEHCTEWEATTLCCARAGFTIGVRRTSLFGFEEDARVLASGVRVY